MTTDDFDLETLARYLHLQVAQVQKMVDRGHLPGRRIAGKWRFSPAAIHHWFEDRIGASGGDELAAMETVLDRQPDEQEFTSVSALLREEAIEPALVARTRNSVIEAMTELVARTGLLWDPPQMADAVRARENLHPTALDNGVALLHPRRPLASILAEPVIALGRTCNGIPFGGERGTLTDVFFLICSVTDAGHLKTLARLSRLLASPGFLEELRSASDVATVWDVVRRFEQQL